VEHARAAPIARHRAHRAPIGHHCSVALAQDAANGRLDLPSVREAEAMSIAGELAQFLTSTNVNDLPPLALERARMVIASTISRWCTSSKR